MAINSAMPSMCPDTRCPPRESPACSDGSRFTGEPTARSPSVVSESQPKTSTKTLGYTIGGPIGKPGGTNKLFFFYSHEYRPVTQAINNGNTIRIRVPTAAERAGDFSQTRDNNGALFNLIKDPQSTAPCTAASTAGCFQAGGVLGRIPADRLYSTGIALLNRYPMPNVTQATGPNYNYEVQPPTTDNLTQQPAIRVDYQLSPNLRFTGKYSGQRARRLITPGTIAGFNDVLNPHPYITNYGVTVNYTMNSSTFIEGTYGFIRNQLAGGASIGATGTGGILVNDSSNRLASLPGFPLLYPDAGVVDERYYAKTVLDELNPVWYDGQRINMPPAFGWGSRIMGTAGVGALPGVPNQVFPGFLNINRTQDVAISMTKVWGAHTIKAGFYNNHSFKAQNTGAGGVANLGFQGYVNFGNDTNNALDTGFGYANAAVGVFTQYLQQSRLIEGSMIYNNTEFYLQDNWKVTSRLTLDYGMRFTRQQPQHDQFGQMSNFFPDQWSRSAAPLLYLAGCNNGATVVLGQREERGRSPHRSNPDGNGRRQYAGGHRHGRAEFRQPDQRRPSGGRRHREDVVCVAQAGDGAAVRHGLRPDRQPEHHSARRRRAVLRPSRRQYGVFDSGQSANLDLAGSPQRSTADARLRASAPSASLQ